MAGVTLNDLLARANMHDDPIRFPLEYIDAQITRLELIAAREPMPQGELERITRMAAIGANAQAVALIRAANLRAVGLIIAGWTLSVVGATAALLALFR